MEVQKIKCVQQPHDFVASYSSTILFAFISFLFSFISDWRDENRRTSHIRLPLSMIFSSFICCRFFAIELMLARRSITARTRASSEWTKEKKTHRFSIQTNSWLWLIWNTLTDEDMIIFLVARRNLFLSFASFCSVESISISSLPQYLHKNCNQFHYF